MACSLNRLAEVRRRVYDVLPVLEALGIVTRTGRVYEYHGIERLPKTLRWLKARIATAKNVMDNQGPTSALPHRAAVRYLERVFMHGPIFDDYGNAVDSLPSIDAVSAGRLTRTMAHIMLTELR